MMIQHIRVRLNGPDLATCLPGQFVCRPGTAERYAFVYSVDREACMVEIVLFQPEETEVHSTIEILSATLPNAMALLEETLRNAVPEIQEMWRNALRQ